MALQPFETNDNPIFVERVRRLIADTGTPSTTVSGTQTYLFQDHELYEYIKDATYLVAMDINEDYYIDASELISPEPTGIVGALITLKAAILIRQGLTEEGYRDGIYIKDGDTVIDTTKILQQRGVGLAKVNDEYIRYVDKYLMGEITGQSINTFDYLAPPTEGYCFAGW